MPSFGETLKREREARQISLREIAEATKINLRYLDALERNEFRHLPGGVFNKGFVRAFAQHIGVDPEPMVAAYLREVQIQEARVHERDSARGLPAGDAPGTFRASRPSGFRPWHAVVLVAAVGIVAVAAAVILWPRGRGPSAVRWPGHGQTAAAPPAAEAPATPPAAGGAAGAPESPAEGPAATTPAAEGAPEPEPGGAWPRSGVEAPTEPPAEPARPAGATGDGFLATVIVDRQVRGRIDCDGETVKLLDPLEAGARIELRCRDALTLDVDDGGAVRVGLNGAEPAPAGLDGEALTGLRLAPPSSEAGPPPGERP